MQKDVEQNQWFHRTFHFLLALQVKGANWLHWKKEILQWKIPVTFSTTLPTPYCFSASWKCFERKIVQGKFDHNGSVLRGGGGLVWGICLFWCTFLTWLRHVEKNPLHTVKVILTLTDCSNKRKNWCSSPWDCIHRVCAETYRLCMSLIYANTNWCLKCAGPEIHSGRGGG